VRDIWTSPPGQGRQPKGSPRPYLRAFIASSLVVLMGVGAGVLYRWVQTSTPVSTDRALREFRLKTSRTTEPKKHAQAKKRREESGATTQKQSRKSAPRKIESTSLAAAAPSKTSRRTTKSHRPTTKPVSYIDRPAEGVYTWKIEGYEQIPGVRRDLPERSNRVITHYGSRGFVQHHTFSEQRETWNWAAIEPHGVVVEKSRNRVDFGPFTVDRTIHFNPPMQVGPTPYKLGETWRGSWSGKTSGNYQGRTLDHTHMTIDGERVEIWVTEVVLHMQGEVEGDALYRNWVAPEYDMVVKQYEKTSARSGPGEYRSEWMGEVVSLDPRT
jgi:hypothetical protein